MNADNIISKKNSDNFSEIDLIIEKLFENSEFIENNINNSNIINNIEDFNLNIEIEENINKYKTYSNNNKEKNKLNIKNVHKDYNSIDRQIEEIINSENKKNEIDSNNFNNNADFVFDCKIEEFDNNKNILNIENNTNKIIINNEDYDFDYQIEQFINNENKKNNSSCFKNSEKNIKLTNKKKDLDFDYQIDELIDNINSNNLDNKALYDEENKHKNTDNETDEIELIDDFIENYDKNTKFLNKECEDIDLDSQIEEFINKTSKKRIEKLQLKPTENDLKNDKFFYFSEEISICTHYNREFFCENCHLAYCKICLENHNLCKSKDKLYWKYPEKQLIFIENLKQEEKKFEKLKEKILNFGKIPQNYINSEIKKVQRAKKIIIRFINTHFKKIINSYKKYCEDIFQNEFKKEILLNITNLMKVFKQIDEINNNFDIEQFEKIYKINYKKEVEFYEQSLETLKKNYPTFPSIKYNANYLSEIKENLINLVNIEKYEKSYLNFKKIYQDFKESLQIDFKINDIKLNYRDTISGKLTKSNIDLKTGKASKNINTFSNNLNNKLAAYIPELTQIVLFDIKTNEIYKINYKINENLNEDHLLPTFTNLHLDVKNNRIYLVANSFSDPNTGETIPLKELYQINAESNSFEFLDSVEKTRIRCASILDQQEIYFFGGCLLQEKILTKTCIKYSITDKNWVKLPEMSKIRIGASACIFQKKDKKKIYIFGGAKDILNLEESIEIFDLDIFKWENPLTPVNSFFYIPKASMYTVQINDEEIVIFGGISSKYSLNKSNIYQKFNTFTKSIVNYGNILSVGVGLDGRTSCCILEENEKYPKIKVMNIQEISSQPQKCISIYNYYVCEIIQTDKIQSFISLFDIRNT